MNNNGNRFDQEETTIPTSRGKVVRLQSVSPHFLTDLMASQESLEVPQREIPTDIPGHSEREPLSEKDLRTDEERKIWSEYQAKRRKILTDANQRFLEAIYFRGILMDDQDLDDWKEEREYFGLEVPEKRIQQKIKYIQDEVIGSTEDILNIVLGVLEKTGIPEEEMARVEAMFRGSVRRRTSEEIEATFEQVDLERDIQPDEGSPLLGSLATE